MQNIVAFKRQLDIGYRFELDSFSEKMRKKKSRVRSGERVFNCLPIPRIKMQSIFINFTMDEHINNL